MTTASLSSESNFCNFGIDCVARICPKAVAAAIRTSGLESSSPASASSRACALPRINPSARIPMACSLVLFDPAASNIAQAFSLPVTACKVDAVTTHAMTTTVMRKLHFEDKSTLPGRCRTPGKQVQRTE